LIPAALLFDVSGLERAVLIAVAILGLIVELLNSEVSRRKSVGAVTVRFWPIAAGDDRHLSARSCLSSNFSSVPSAQK